MNVLVKYLSFPAKVFRALAFIVILSIFPVLGSAQTIAFSSANPAVPAANPALGSTKQLIYRAVIVLSGFNGSGANLTKVTFTPGGTFVAADISNYQFWWNTTDDLATATQNAPNATVQASGAQVTISPYSPWFYDATTYYAWITADISASATNGHTLTVAALTTSNFTFTAGTKSGTMYAGGAQTLGTIKQFRSTTSGNWSSTSTWQQSTNGGTSWTAATTTPTSSDGLVTIQNGHTVTVTANVSVDQVIVNAGGQITVNSSSTLTIADGVGTDLSVDGKLVNFGTVTATGTLAFNSGSTYQHAVNGGTIPTATWDAASTCLVTGVTSTVPTTSTFNQSFGNFTWNCTGQSANIALAGNLRTINGDFTVSSTNNSQLQLSSGTTATLTVGGNFAMTAGTLNFNSGSGTFTMAVAGDFLHTGGTITESSTGTGAIVFNGGKTQTYTSGGTISNTINFTVNSGTILQMAAEGTTISGGGSFTLSSGATLGVTSANGITTGTTASGNIRVTGTRTYSTGANYIYNGTSAQVTGNGLNQNTPANLTINNSSGVTLSAATSISGILTLTNGVLKTTTANLLTLTNTATTAVSGGSSTSFINGPVKWTLPASLATGSTYNFPVGSGTTYLPFALVNPTTGTGAVTAQVEAFASDPGGSVDATLDSKSATEYWSLVTSGNFTNSSVSIIRQTAIAPLDAIGGSTAQGGTYANLGGTPGAYGISSSNAIGTNRFFVLAKGKPAITTSISSLTGFTYPMGSGPSGQQSFTVGGTYLTTNITVLPTDSFEISSASGASFAPQSVITLNVINGIVATSTVYVRMKAGFAVGTVKSVSNPITCSSTGATNKTISCTGTVTTAPVITATPASLTGFNYTFTDGPSAQQSFTVSGTNLIGNITVTPPTDYEISTTSGSGFASTALSVASGTIIYVRLKSGLGVGSWSENIVLTSTSANPVNVACSGTVGPAPTILNAISALSAFIYTSGAGPSGEQSFTVSGSNLTANLVITPLANFQISLTTGSGFTSSAISLSQSGGTVNTTTIYVRMKAGLAVGSYGPENITLTSTGASGKAVSCKGSVVSAAAITTSTLTLTGFGYKQYSAGDAGTGVANGGPSSEQSFIVAGTSLGSNNVTITPPANFEISQTSGGTFQTGAITLTPSSGKVNTIIYVRLKSLLPAGDYTGNIAVASSGLTTINVACVGKVFATPLITASSDGGTYCPGSTINLTSTGDDIQNRYWEGPNNFYSVSQNPQLTTNATTALSGTYTVTGNVVVGGNLVTNGDFEAGNTSFGSSNRDTVDVSGSTQELWKEGYYAVVANPHSVHTNFSTNGDHTSGTGLQMVVNGAPVAGVVIWSQSVPVVPGANYQFTYWEQTVVAENPSRLQLYVNGIAAGPIYTASASINNWTQFLYNASAGTNSVLNLELINQNTIASGNDFALDDIVFQQVLSATASTDVSVTPNVPVSVSVAVSANPVTQGATVTYTATPTNGGTTPAYAWYVNNNLVTGATSSTYSYVPSNGDVVKCVLTSSISCATNNPATSNTVTMTVNPPVNYWRGTNGTDWGTASNWTAGYIPAPGDNVVYASTTNSWGSDAINDLVLDIDRTIGSLINATSKRLVIPAGKSLTVNNTITTNGNPGLIYIHSNDVTANGSLIYHNSESSPVYATVEMYTKSSWDLSKPVNQKYSWQYFGIPVSRFKASPTFDGAIVRQMLESGNDTTTHWQSLTNDSYLEPFRGYELCYESPRIITFSGALINANFNSGQLVKTITGGALYPGQHLFANSYTAAIDIRQIQFGSEMDSTVYMYNTGTFAQWQALKSTRIGNTPGQYTSAPQNLAGYSQVPRQVPSMNSMLVRIKAGISVPTANSYISINYNSVAMGNTDLQRAPAIEGNESPACTIIDVESELSSDRMWIFTKESCKRTFDNGDDGVKMGGSALSPQIYGIEPDGNYQIDAVDDMNNTNLAFQAGQDTEYTLTFTHENIAGRYSNIYLLDLAERTVVDITETGSTYSFTAQSTPKAVNRFRIITSPEETGNETPSKINIFNSYNSVYVLNNSQQPGDMYIYDISGRSFGHQKVAANSISTIPITLQNAYIVKFVSPEETKTEKIIIR